MGFLPQLDVRRPRGLPDLDTVAAVTYWWFDRLQIAEDSSVVRIGFGSGAAVDPGALRLDYRFAHITLSIRCFRTTARSLVLDRESVIVVLCTVAELGNLLSA